MSLCRLFIAILFLLLETKSQVYISTNGTYIGYRISKTFQEAQRYCEITHGTKLASIHSLQQATEIYDLVKTVAFYSYYYTWIGLSDENYYGHLYWSDGQPYNWSAANLASSTNKHCWYLSISGIWYNVECSLAKYFICNANPTWTKPLDLSFMPPINVLGTSIDGSMTLFNHSASFMEADAYCQRMLNTHLISITNYEQAEQAQELCSRTTTDTLCWIGLTQIFQNGYEWTDGSDVGYYRFDSNADLSHDCTAIKSNEHSTIYSWTTNKCYDEAYKTVFICSTYPPTPYPTKVPTKAPITTSPTKYPSVSPTMSPYIMIEVSGNYICSELADRVAIFYDISYDECITECKHNYGGQCQMINHRADTTPSRCYIFDKQCTINSNNGVSRVAFIGWKHFCVDYPVDWNDINGDACYGYTDVLGYCDNGNITVTVSEIESKATDFNGIQTCCGCGGGAESIDDITMAFGQIQQNSYDLLCEWSYGNPINTVYKTWDNIMLYNLCERLHDRINLTVDDIDCNQFIDSSYSGNINFISCDFDEYNRNNDELYFLFMINKDMSSSSITTYINSDWFQLTRTLLPKAVTVMSYSQCISSLWAASANTVYAAMPCEGDITMVTTTTTGLPTNSPSANIVTDAPTISVLTTHAAETTRNPTRKPTTSKVSATTSIGDNYTVTSSGEIEGGYIQKTDEDSNDAVMVLLVIILLVVIFIGIVVIGILYLWCKKMPQNEITKTTETGALKVQMSHVNHVIPTHTPTDDSIENEMKPLPKGWVKVVGTDKRVYYQNNFTKQTQWDRPLK